MSRTTQNILVAVPVALLLLAILIPHWAKSRTTVEKSSCLANLYLIEGAKTQWAFEGHGRTNEAPVEAELLPFLGPRGRPATVLPSCPAGGSYTIGRIDQAATCSVGGPAHSLPVR
jgi:hypothetical protein